MRVYDLETREYTRLAERGGAWALWMADDRVLMFFGGDNVILDPETGEMQEIKGPEGFQEVVLSPDNTRAYFTDVKLEGHIWLMEIQEAGR